MRLRLLVAGLVAKAAPCDQPRGPAPGPPEYFARSKSGEAFGAGLSGRCGTLGEDRAEAGHAILPALTAGSAQGGQMRGPVVGVRVGLAGGGAEEVEVDAVHGFRPIAVLAFRNAMKHGILRIRIILET